MILQALDVQVRDGLAVEHRRQCLAHCRAPHSARIVSHVAQVAPRSKKVPGFRPSFSGTMSSRWGCYQRECIAMANDALTGGPLPATGWSALVALGTFVDHAHGSLRPDRQPRPSLSSEVRVADRHPGDHGRSPLG
jgi:hypothetical protein